jgi:eukaryotic-like serine/threonine-protein kinase
MIPADRYRRVDALLDAALQQPPAARAAFLDAACAGDPDLRTEVEALLASHDAADSFLASSALEAEARAMAGALIGRTLGPYQVRSLIGAGGMGEVYRAHDPRLGRDVAVKILPPSLSHGREARARFEREARAVAALSHPNILAIHDVGADDGVAYAVTELLDGETLRQRLAASPLAWRKAVALAAQIADGLAAAHAQGIVHRDLKPENVVVTSSGLAKILDFGLAQVAQTTSTSLAEIVRLSEPGMLMGTPGYMSPEQVRGEPVGPASDIFAFGCLLYEMLAGRGPFLRAAPAESLAAVLNDDPAPLARDGPEVPPVLESLVLHCLEKRPADRFHSTHDVAFALRTLVGLDVGAGVPPVPPGAGTSTARRRWSLAAVLIAGVALGAAGFWLLSNGPAPAPQLARLSLPLPPDTGLMANDTPAAGSSTALSPDGRWIAYVALHAGQRRLVVRGLDRADATLYPGTDGAQTPMFSPDGQWIAFFTESALKKVPLAGGTPTTLSPAPPVTRGGVWADDGQIYFTRSFTAGVQRIPAAGGPLAEVTQVDVTAGESNHLLPEVLPGARALLYTMWQGGDFATASVWSCSLSSGERKRLLDSASAPRYVPPGFLVFARGGALFAVRFDVTRLLVVGEPVPVVDSVWTDRASGTAHYAISRTGTLVYAAGEDTIERRRLVLVDRRGRIEPLPAELNLYGNPRFSPDGRRLAVEALNDLWVYDLGDRTLSRVTFRGVNQFPVWTPDGARLTYSSSHGVATPTVFWTAIAGGEPTPLSQGGAVQFPASWAPDGSLLAYAETANTETGWDIWVLRPGEAGSRRVLIQTPFKEDQPMISPDGGAMAYVSDETGRMEVYLRRFPDLGQRARVSIEGGSEPVWSRRGDELFYRNDRQYFSVPVALASGSIRVGRPSRLFEGDFLHASLFPGHPSYDVTPDGQRFVAVTRSDDTPRPARLEVVLGWVEDLERRLGRGAVP